MKMHLTFTTLSYMVYGFANDRIMYDVYIILHMHWRWLLIRIQLIFKLTHQTLGLLKGKLAHINEYHIRSLKIYLQQRLQLTEYGRPRDNPACLPGNSEYPASHDKETAWQQIWNRVTAGILTRWLSTRSQLFFTADHAIFFLILSDGWLCVYH